MAKLNDYRDRDDASLLAIARLAAFWWEQQLHPYEDTRPGAYFARKVVKGMLGNAAYVQVLSDNSSEIRFAGMIAVAQTLFRVPSGSKLTAFCGYCGDTTLLILGNHCCSCLRELGDDEA